MKQKLSPETLDDLKRSGLNEKDAQRMGITEPATDFTNRPRYRIPYYDMDGRPILDSGKPFYRDRNLDPLPTDKDGDPLRYTQPKDSDPHAYFSTLTKRPWRAIAKDTKTPLVITEGEKKAACACKYGLVTIGLGGVWNFRSKKRGIDFLPALKEVDWKERPVTVAYDSDASKNGNVLYAEQRLVRELRAQGAVVDIKRLPARKNGAKQGLDDFVLARGVKAFRDLKSERPEESGSLILDRRDHIANAIAFVKSGKAAHVHYYNGDLYEWHESHYAIIPDAVVRARLYKFLKTAKVPTKDGVEPFFPSRRSVSDVLDALRGETELHTAAGIEYDEERTGAFWLGAQQGRPAAEDLLPCANGLLDLNTFKLLPHTPALFNTFALPYAYDPRAPKPKRWLAFLRELWPNDPESINALQEMFGLLLTTDTSHHKIFMIVGPPRSGKGTILRLLTELLGKRNVVAPTLDSFSNNFGLQPLINKTLGIVADARLGSQSNHSRITELMLSVSGEDSQTIDRKHKPAWTGRLPIRFLLTANEIPKFADASGALASRFITMKHTESFLGNEDRTLGNKLRPEVPSILNWSLDGLRRLRKRGHFVQPKSAHDVIQELSDLASPTKAFLREWCNVGEGRYIQKDQLFACWREWNKVKGNEKYAGNEITFGRNLRAALPKLKDAKKWIKVDGESRRVWVYVGLDIIAERVATDKPVKARRRKF